VKKYILPALIISSPQLIVSLISTSFYQSKFISLIIGLIYIVVSFFLFLHFLKKYKTNELNNEMPFSKGFAYSFKLSLLWAFFCGIISVIYSYMRPEVTKAIMERTIAEQKQKIIEQYGSMPLSDENNLRAMLEFNQNPFVIAGGTIIYLIFIGLIISLIAASVSKSKVNS